MQTIKEIYRIGHGPSSSHTMAPRFAAEQFLERYPDAAAFEVTLYGSLAATGKGHFTDVAILEVLQPHAKVNIVWQPKIFLPLTPLSALTAKAVTPMLMVLAWLTLLAEGCF